MALVLIRKRGIERTCAGPPVTYKRNRVLRTKDISVDEVEAEVEQRLALVKVCDDSPSIAAAQSGNPVPPERPSPFKHTASKILLAGNSQDTDRHEEHTAKSEVAADPQESQRLTSPVPLTPLSSEDVGGRSVGEEADKQRLQRAENVPIPAAQEVSSAYAVKVSETKEKINDDAKAEPETSTPSGSSPEEYKRLSASSQLQLPSAVVLQASPSSGSIAQEPVPPLEYSEREIFVQPAESLSDEPCQSPYDEGYGEELSFLVSKFDLKEEASTSGFFMPYIY